MGRGLTAHATDDVQSALTGRVLAVLLCVLGAKLWAVIRLGQWASASSLVKLTWLSQDVLLALLLVALLVAAERSRAALGRHAVWALAIAVILANTLLILTLEVTQSYLAPRDSHVVLGTKVLAGFKEFGTPGRYAVLIGSSLAPFGVPALVRRFGPGIGRALGAARGRWRTGLVAAVLYTFAPLVVPQQTALAALPLARNPTLHYLWSAVAPPALMHPERQPPRSRAELSARLEPVARAAGMIEHGGAVSELGATRANVVLVLLESVGASALSLGGAPEQTHPHLARLHERGVLFSRYSTPAPHSAAAMASLFCSRFPAPFEPVATLLERCRPLPGALSRAGVRTAFFQSSYGADWIGDSFFRKLGFDEMLDSARLADRRKSQGRPIQLVDGRALEHDTVQALLEWVDGQCQASTPFFGVWYSWVAHAPYPAAHGGTAAIDPRLPERERYRALIRTLDDQVKRLDEALASKSCGRPTVLIVTGDHGEAFHEHPGNQYHAAYTYQENVRVPLWIVAPGLTGRTLDRVASHVDLTPTIAELALGPDAAAPFAAESGDGLPFVGRSLLRPAPPLVTFSVALLGDRMVAARFGQFKLIRSLAGSKLFDTDADPGERSDLSARQPALAQALEEAIDSWAAEQERLSR